MQIPPGLRGVSFFRKIFYERQCMSACAPAHYSLKNPMKYLVTGAAGFLGTNLGWRLLNDGHEVIGLDIYHSGSKSIIVSLLK